MKSSNCILPIISIWILIIVSGVVEMHGNATAADLCGENLSISSVWASAEQSANPAQNVIDGDLTTRWSGKGIGTQLIVKLARTASVCSVGVAWYHGDERVNNFSIAYSEDNVNYTQAYEGVSDYGSDVQYYPISPVDARYIKLTVNGNTINAWASVLEFVVNGDAGDDDPLPYGLGNENGPQGNWQLKLNENFDGVTLDTSIWSTGWWGAGITPPVHEEELACYDPAQVEVSGGILKLKAVSKSTSCGDKIRPYVSGAINSRDKIEFSYGYFEARIWLDADASAIYNWPGWWLDGHNWPFDGELDIMEGLGGSAKATWHGPEKKGENGKEGDGFAFGDAGVLSGWHVFAAEWQPGKVTSYYDGVKLGEYSSSTNITSSPQYLILMAQISPEEGDGSYGGPIKIPSEMNVDYVRVWQRE